MYKCAGHCPPHPPPPNKGHEPSTGAACPLDSAGSRQNLAQETTPQWDAVLSTVMGCDAKVVGRDFCNSLAKYFEMGGDGRIDDIAASLRQKGN